MTSIILKKALAILSIVFLVLAVVTFIATLVYLTFFATGATNSYFSFQYLGTDDSFVLGESSMLAAVSDSVVDIMPSFGQFEKKYQELFLQKDSNSTLKVRIGLPKNRKDGTHIFTARLGGFGSADYVLFWRRQGSQTYHLMSNGESGVKSSFVDTSTWSGSKEGSYIVTFFAQTVTGKLITEASIRMDKHFFPY